jgi:hypothetical protein
LATTSEVGDLKTFLTSRHAAILGQLGACSVFYFPLFPPSHSPSTHHILVWCVSFLPFPNLNGHSLVALLPFSCQQVQAIPVEVEGALHVKPTVVAAVVAAVNHLGAVVAAVDHPQMIAGPRNLP